MRQFAASKNRTRPPAVSVFIIRLSRSPAPAAASRLYRFVVGFCSLATLARIAFTKSTQVETAVTEAVKWYFEQAQPGRRHKSSSFHGRAYARMLQSDDDPTRRFSPTNMHRLQPVGARSVDAFGRTETVSRLHLPQASAVCP